VTGGVRPAVGRVCLFVLRIPGSPIALITVPTPPVDMRLAHPTLVVRPGHLDRPPAPAASTPPRPPARRGARRALDATVNLVLVAAVLAIATLGVLAANGLEPRLELSDSMAPVLAAGDLLWIRPIPAQDARVGEVIAFDDPQRARVLLHRVERKGTAGGRLAFVTRGDAVDTSERWEIEPSGTVGKYTGLKIPAVGEPLARLQHRGLILGVLGVIGAFTVALIALSAVWRRP